MAPKTLIRYEQVRRRGEEPDVQASDAPFAEGRYFEASCPSAIAVNDCVLVIGTNGGGRPKIKKVDPADPDSMPAVGVVVEKASPQICLVQVSGLITSLSGFTAGARYYVGPSGTPVSPEPTTPLKQLVGVALGASKLLLFPNQSTNVSGGEGTLVADCAVGDEIGNLVCFGTPVSQLPYVTTADITDVDLTPAVGVIVGKPSSTTCLVQRGGSADLGVSDLVPGKTCFIWFDGRPFTTYPGVFASSSGYAMIQVVGVAVSSSSISLNPTAMRIRVNTAGNPPPPSR